MRYGDTMPDEMEPQLTLSEDELLPCAIFIDREGDWHYRGSRMERSDIVSHLCQHMGRDEASGLYIVQLGKQRCYLEVEDTPLAITGVLHTEESFGPRKSMGRRAKRALLQSNGGWDPGSVPAPRLLPVGRVYPGGQRAEPILPVSWRKTFLYRLRWIVEKYHRQLLAY
jgi:hypothetical protein